MLMPNIASIEVEIAKAMYQARGGLGTSAMRETLSVTRAKSLSPLGGLVNGLTSLTTAMTQLSSGLGFLTRAR